MTHPTYKKGATGLCPCGTTTSHREGSGFSCPRCVALEKASRGGGIAGGRRHSEGIKKKRKPFSERPSSWAERHDPNTTPICGASLATLEQMLKRAA